MLDVTRLRVLAAVARHGSVTAAAKALNYAQPSVSHHLARLEAETGTRLVERAGRGVRLTDAGRLLAGRAEEILGRLDAAEHELAAHIGQREERIRVAGFPSALATVVPAAAGRLRADHPGAELLLAEAEPQSAVRMLRAGRVDVALVFSYLQQGAGPPQGPAPSPEGGQRPGGDEEEGVRARPLLEEPVHLVTQAGAAPPPRAAGSPLAGYAEHRWIAGCERCRVTCCGSASWPVSSRRSRSPPTTCWSLRRWPRPGWALPCCPTWRCAQPGTRGCAPSRCPVPAARWSR